MNFDKEKIDRKLADATDAYNDFEKGRNALVAALNEGIERANRQMKNRPEHWANVKKVREEEVAYLMGLKK